MSVRTRLFATTFAITVFFATSEFTLMSSALAQDAPAPPASIKAALEQQSGKRAKVRLVSGQDLEGRVQSVGTDVVIISELAGMEFFGATVRLDQVAAVISRMDGR
jgi:hypothetical protein